MILFCGNSPSDVDWEPLIPPWNTTYKIPFGSEANVLIAIIAAIFAAAQIVRAGLLAPTQGFKSYNRV